MNSLYSFSNVKCIYTFVLKFSDSSISEFSFTSILDVSKKIDAKTFPKSKDNNIRSTIATLYSISATLALF